MALKTMKTTCLFYFHNSPTPLLTYSLLCDEFPSILNVLWLEPFLVKSILVTPGVSGSRYKTSSMLEKKGKYFVRLPVLLPFSLFYSGLGIWSILDFQEVNISFYPLQFISDPQLQHNHTASSLPRACYADNNINSSPTSGAPREPA